MGVTDGAKNGHGHHNFRESLIRALAETQGGHIEPNQLRMLGLTNHAVAHLLRRGFLIRAHRGV
jgi:hypothetical protein